MASMCLNPWKHWFSPPPKKRQAKKCQVHYFLLVPLYVCPIYNLPAVSRLGCPKNSKHLIFDLIWTFRIFRILDLNIFELWISVFDLIWSELRIFRISRIYSDLENCLPSYNRPISFSLFLEIEVDNNYVNRIVDLLPSKVVNRYDDSTVCKCCAQGSLAHARRRL